MKAAGIEDHDTLRALFPEGDELYLFIPVLVSGKKLTCRLLYETLNEYMASFEYRSINENKQTSPAQFIAVQHP